jgi:hypothetical protein
LLSNRARTQDCVGIAVREDEGVKMIRLLVCAAASGLVVGVGVAAVGQLMVYLATPPRPAERSGTKGQILSFRNWQITRAAPAPERHRPIAEDDASLAG